MKHTLLCGLAGFIILFSQTGYSTETLPNAAPVITTVMTRIEKSENTLNALINEVIALGKTHQKDQARNINPLIDYLWGAQTICKYERQIWELMSLLNQKDGVTQNYLSYRSKMMKDSVKLIDIRLDLMETRIKELVTTRDIFLAYEKSIKAVASVKQQIETSDSELEGLISPSGEKK